MKETMQQHLHTVGQKAIQNVIRHEYGDWPPKSGGLYSVSYTHLTLPTILRV